MEVIHASREDEVIQAIINDPNAEVPDAMDYFDDPKDGVIAYKDEEHLFPHVLAMTNRMTTAIRNPEEAQIRRRAIQGASARGIEKQDIVNVLVNAAPRVGKSEATLATINRLLIEKPDLKVLWVDSNVTNLKSNRQKAVNRLGDNMAIGHVNDIDNSSESQFVFASFQTLQPNYDDGDPTVKDLFFEDEFDVVVIDETHQLGAETRETAAEYFKPSVMLHLTGTLERLDGIDVRRVTGPAVIDISMAAAIRNGWLSPFRYVSIMDDTTLELIKQEKLTVGAANAAVEPVDPNMRAFAKRSAQKLAEQGIKDPRVLVFSSTIQAAEDMAQVFGEQGINILPVHHEIDKREQVDRLIDFEDERMVNGVSSVTTLAHGLDFSEIDAVIMGRGTQSEGLWRQLISRGLLPDKEELLLIDWVASDEQLKWVSTLLLGIAGIEQDPDKVFRRSNNGEPVDPGSLRGMIADPDSTAGSHFELTEREIDFMELIHRSGRIETLKARFNSLSCFEATDYWYALGHLLGEKVDIKRINAFALEGEYPNYSQLKDARIRANVDQFALNRDVNRLLKDKEIGWLDDEQDIHRVLFMLATDIFHRLPLDDVDSHRAIVDLGDGRVLDLRPHYQLFIIRGDDGHLELISSLPESGSHSRLQEPRSLKENLELFESLLQARARLESEGRLGHDYPDYYPLSREMVESYLERFNIHIAQAREHAQALRTASEFAVPDLDELRLASVAIRVRSARQLSIVSEFDDRWSDRVEKYQAARGFKDYDERFADGIVPARRLDRLSVEDLPRLLVMDMYERATEARTEGGGLAWDQLLIHPLGRQYEEMTIYDLSEHSNIGNWYALVDGDFRFRPIGQQAEADEVGIETLVRRLITVRDSLMAAGELKRPYSGANPYSQLQIAQLLSQIDTTDLEGSLSQYNLEQKTAREQLGRSYEALLPVLQQCDDAAVARIGADSYVVRGNEFGASLHLMPAKGAKKIKGGGKHYQLIRNANGELLVLRNDSEEMSFYQVTSSIELNVVQKQIDHVLEFNHDADVVRLDELLSRLVMVKGAETFSGESLKSVDLHALTVVRNLDSNPLRQFIADNTGVEFDMSVPKTKSRLDPLVLTRLVAKSTDATRRGYLRWMYELRDQQRLVAEQLHADLNNYFDNNQLDRNPEHLRKLEFEFDNQRFDLRFKPNTRAGQSRVDIRPLIDKTNGFTAILARSDYNDQMHFGDIMAFAPWPTWGDSTYKPDNSLFSAAEVASEQIARQFEHHAQYTSAAESRTNEQQRLRDILKVQMLVNHALAQQTGE